MAREFRVVADDSWCGEGSLPGQVRHCEVREAAWPAGEALVLDATPNGGIEVEAWERDEVRVRARVTAGGDDAEEARRVASEVHLAAAGAVSVAGPPAHGSAPWSVSFRVSLPARSDLDLRTKNGGITVRGLSGRIDLETTNGGLHLLDVGGRVRARTENGGVEVVASGSGWPGEGLDVQTTNGRVDLTLPRDYHAHLVVRTDNGKVDLDLPEPVQGRVRGEVETDLGKGGPTLRLVTKNGRVVLRVAS